MESQIQAQEQERYEQLEAQFKAMKKENEALRTILNRKDQTIKENEGKIEQLQAQLQEKQASQGRESSQKSTEPRVVFDVPNSEEDNTEKSNGRLSMSGHKHFYATIVPDGAADIFGMEDGQAQGRASMKPPVPKMRTKKLDVQLLKQKDRFLTKNRLRDYNQAVKSSSKLRLKQQNSHGPEDLGGDPNKRLVGSFLTDAASQQSGSAAGSHTSRKRVIKLDLQKLQMQRELDALKNFPTQRVIVRQNKVGNAYQTPQNERKSWGAASTKGKSTE